MLLFYSHGHNTWSTAVTKLEKRSTRHLLSFSILLSKQQPLPHLAVISPLFFCYCINNTTAASTPPKVTITPKEQKGP